MSMSKVVGRSNAQGLARRKRRDTRRTIIDCALKLFASLGFENVTMRMFAADVGINPATLYHHFKDKESLYVEMLETLYRDVETRFLETLSRKNLSARDNLKRYVKDFSRFAYDHPDFIRLIKREQLDADPARLKLLLDRFIGIQLRYTQTVMKELRPGKDSLMAALAIHSLVLHPYEARVFFRMVDGWTAKQEDPDYVADFIISLFLK